MGHSQQPMEAGTGASFHFATLTPDLILDALASCGFYLESGLTPLGSYENRVYQFVAEDRQRYVVKFYRPQRWSAAQIQQEHQLALFLAEQEVSVAAPLVIAGRTLQEYQGFYFALWPSLGGRHLEPDNLDQLEAVGHQLGLWHSVAHQCSLAQRPAMGAEWSLLQPITRLTQAAPWPASLSAEFAELFSCLKLALLPVLAQPFELLSLHGDCHIGNILWRDKPLLVDLDDCLRGPAIQDLWLLLSGEEAEQRLQLDALLAGYEEFSHFDMSQLKLIEPLRTLRMLNHIDWLTRRWADPAFPAAFPWFGTDDYWLEQAKNLRQQLERLKQPPLALTPAY